MASVVPSHGPALLSPLLSSLLTNNFNLTASSRHPGPAKLKLTWLLLLWLLLVGKNRYLPFIFYPVDWGWLGGP